MKFDPSPQVVYADSPRADTAAFDAGNAIESNGGSCSTGAVIERSGYNDYMLTAAHCVAYSNSKVVKTPAGRTVGTSSWLTTLWGANGAYNVGEITPLDAALITIADGSGGLGSTQLFQGGPNTTTKVSVAGTAALPQGTTLCVSGGSTGYRCNMTFTGTRSTLCGGYNSQGACSKYLYIAQVRSTNSSLIFGQGDSGGPIYYINSGGKRLIVGIVQGFPSTAAYGCGEASHYDFVSCTKSIGYVTEVSRVFSKLSGNGFDIKGTG